MAAVLDALVTLLTLEPTEENVFRGQAQDLGWGRLYGGHVLGQALSAASQTTPADRHAHSVHAYFLRPGDVTTPIYYGVDRPRDGQSFTTRRVLARQGDHVILNLAVSYQIDEPGFDHQDVVPAAPPPESLLPEHERVKAYASRLPAFLAERLSAEQPFDVRTTRALDDPFHPKIAEPHSMVWFRTVDKVPDGHALHQSLLAYASDSNFLTASLLPHGVNWLTPGMQLASLDHVMWFHRPFRIDDWLLHVVESPSAFGARALVRGRVFDRAGRLVASTAQEALVRQRTRGAS